MPNPDGAKRSTKLTPTSTRPDASTSLWYITKSIKLIGGSIGQAVILNHDEFQRYVKALARDRLKELHPDVRRYYVWGSGRRRPTRKFQAVLNAYDALRGLPPSRWRAWQSAHTTEPDMELPWALSWDRELQLGYGWQEAREALLWR